MSSEAKVAGHYTSGRLEEVVLKALAAVGKDIHTLTPADLSPIDQFHVGGIDATRELAAGMDLRPGTHLLDVGSGIGGPARYFAGEHSCKVTGIDLTEEFVRVAGRLTSLVRLEHLADFRQASVLALPFPEAAFDHAYMMHVGMNIEDKAGAYREVRRVLKPGARFAVFDILRRPDATLRYPVPWAASVETDFSAAEEVYHGALQAAGFEITEQRSRMDFAIEFTQRAIARMAKTGPPVLGLHLLMGDQAPVMVGNILAMMQEGILEPMELFARAV